MKKPTITLFILFILIAQAISQTTCVIDGPSIVCKQERITVNYSTSQPFTNVEIDAYTVVNGTQVYAIQENKTNSSVEIVFLEGGDAEIIVRFQNGTSITDGCPLNVFVMDEEPIPALGVLSNFVSNQTTCDAIDLDFEMFVLCPECPFYWTLNDEIIEIDQNVAVDEVLQFITANLTVEGIGEYTFCHYILKPDSTCFASDCIELEIVELEIQPSFSIVDQEQEFCLGSAIQFINETEIEESVIYIWEIAYDSLSWKNSGKDLEFDFLYPGEYSVSLQYILTGSENCESIKTYESIHISDVPSFPITCNSSSCLDSIFTYRTQLSCDEYEWAIDESLGEILSEDSSGITVKWNQVATYTETDIVLNLSNCNEESCAQSKRKIVLFPNQISIDGARGICDKGTEWYEADFIPNAEYTWEIERIDSVQGIAPEITLIDHNRIRINYNTYIGKLSVKVTASIESKACIVSNEIIATSIFINTNDDLCPGDLFKGSVIPSIDQDVTWTLTNEENGYFKEQTISGQDQFFAFDLNLGGNYSLSVAVAELDLVCAEDIPLSVIPSPEVILVGPTFICPGESVEYTLDGLGGNDQVTWTIFQDNSSTEIIGNTITVNWIEGGGPYFIKVSRSTEVFVGQVCDSDEFTFEINTIDTQTLEMQGPEVICYDGQAEYQIIDRSGTFIWEIDPPYMGTIIEGDSTELVTIQWHYAPDIPFATLSASSEICDSLYEVEIDVYFEPYIPILIVPDSLCSNTSGEISIDELETYQTIFYYVNDSLVREDALKYTHTFSDTGFVEVRVEVEHPNGCPGLAIITKSVYVIPKLDFDFNLSMPLIQCPKESFEDVIVEVDYQDPDGYYIWTLDGDTIKEGFGNVDLYTFVITKDLILSGAGGVELEITAPDLCPRNRRLTLFYNCDFTACECFEPMVASVDYLTPLECNLASFGGSLDFNTVINPYWQVILGDSVVIIPILSEDDLTQDSFYFVQGSFTAQVSIRGTCDGVTTLNGEVVDTTQCEFIIDDETAQLFNPDFVREYICNDDLTYDIIMTERRLVNSNPPYNSTVTWIINGQEYEGVSILLENQEGGSTLNIEMTQCSLDGTYCCSNQYETEVRRKFAPEIILPNGSCENDLWLFTIDENSSQIQSIIWDFGDGSGSTLILTEKGFMDTLAHDVSVVVTDKLGCVATSEITVQSFPNLIDGMIEFESDPCSPIATLTYIENSESIISSYDWSFPGSPDSSSVQVTSSGNYSLTVTDVNGCTSIALAPDVTVNESFNNGIRFKAENCGFARATINANPEYSYDWFVDGQYESTGSNIQIVLPGEHQIKVISTSLSTNEVCDSIVENLIIFPQPSNPIIRQEKIFCEPFITELSVINYPSVVWSGTGGLTEEGASILLAQNGTYHASIEDENGCVASSSRIIFEQNFDFDPLVDQCIQACREDLDSLGLTISGINEFASNWSWITVDSLGTEYQVMSSSGLVTSLTITSDMYDYVQLQIVQEDCVYRSIKVPLDIEICTVMEEPPVEIICESIDSDHASCGVSIYKCLLSEMNGGPKLYFEGSVTLPMDAVLCTEDSLNVSLNNGDITITDLLFEEIDGKLVVFYSANLIISDPMDYQLNGTVIRFDFCDEEGELSHCYDYQLPYRTCSKDFDCLIDFEGISSGGSDHVNINYCLNLSEVIQDNCTLETYAVTAIISGDINVQTIYTGSLEDGFDNLQCIAVPVSSQDFFSGDYHCIELLIEGDCPNTSCSNYQCGIFGSSNLVQQNTIEAQTIKQDNAHINIEPQENTFQEKSISIFPNPSTGLFTFSFDGSKKGDFILIHNTSGQNIKTINLTSKNRIKLDFNGQKSGLYIATWMQDGEMISSKKFLLLD